MCCVVKKSNNSIQNMYWTQPFSFPTKYDPWYSKDCKEVERKECRDRKIIILRQNLPKTYFYLESSKKTETICKIPLANKKKRFGLTYFFVCVLNIRLI